MNNNIYEQPIQGSQSDELNEQPIDAHKAMVMQINKKLDSKNTKLCVYKGKHYKKIYTEKVLLKKKKEK